MRHCAQDRVEIGVGRPAHASLAEIDAGGEEETDDQTAAEPQQKFSSQVSQISS
jgi:hypothetical protein